MSAASSRSVASNLARLLTQREGNSLLSNKHLEMLTLLRINRKFMEHMRKYYNHKSKDEFKMTVVKLPPPTAAAAPSTPSCSSSTLPDMWETPTSIDATEPRLEVEAVPDDAGINPTVLACAPERRAAGDGWRR